MNTASPQDELKGISDAISNLQEFDTISALVESALGHGFSATEIVENGLRRGVEEVGRKYEKGEYFLSELLYAGDTITNLLGRLKTSMKQGEVGQRGALVLGTVRGDLHDVGKKIFQMLAEISGFTVYDLGVDVEPHRFVEKLKETNGGILGLSTLLTSTLPEVKVVIDELKAADIRSRVKVLIGGNAVTKQFGEEVGADAAALNAVEGIGICKKWAAG